MKLWRRRVGGGRPRGAATNHGSVLTELGREPGGLAAALFEQPGIGFVAIDRAACVVRANAAAQMLAGASPDIAPGAPVHALFAESERAMAAAEIAACLRGQPSRPVFGLVLRGGATVGVSAVALRDVDGPVAGALLRLTDLSAQRELEIQLAQAQKLQAVGQLAGGIAHDFNNLLTAILGAAESVAADPALPGDMAEDVAQIHASAGRGAALVRQLLAFGRQQTLQPVSLALNDVVVDISGLLRRLLGSQIRLEVELEQPGGHVRADPTQLDQVLVNLAVNARDAMPMGGVLTVRTGHETLLRTRTSGAEAIPPGRYLMVEVADTGIGIPREILPRLFEPFFTTRRERGGTGLGLSTVHGIVRQSDGFLDVESAPGRGTSFRVFLPRADDRAMSIPDPPVPGTAPPVGRVERGTVLLVDDEAPVRRLAERALARAGWDVLAAESGEQALALLAERGVQRLVGLVTDMAMHGMDGIEVLRAVRASMKQADLPALLISGYARAALRDALGGEEGVTFLAKPYALGELVDAFAALALPCEIQGPSISREPADLSVATEQVSNIQ